jgi:hypothetical protein
MDVQIEKHLCGPRPRILIWSHTKREERGERRERKCRRDKRRERRRKSCVCDQTKILGPSPHKIFSVQISFL